VKRGQRVGELSKGRTEAPGIVRNPREKVAALDELHGKKPATGVVDELARPHHARMVKALERSKLALESEQEVGPRGADGL
jgi:hypothetical protein